MALEKILKNSSGVPTGEYERIAGGTLYADSPIGTILAFGGADAPAGWMICNGASLLRASYPELFAVIGTAFGSADSTHFNIPDMRESVPKGAGLTGKSNNHMDADGLAVGEFIDDRVQSHEHYIGDSATPQHLGYSDPSGENAGIGNRTVDATIESDRKWIALSQSNVGIAKSGRYGATTEVKSVGVNYIIKAKMVAVPADLASGVEEYIDEKFEVEDLSSQISSTVASGMLCYKCGKTVTLVLYNVLVTSNGRITGVPKNANIATGTLISSDATASGYLSIGGIGDNYINVNTGATNKYYYGSITYFTND